jgi:hypothetical protein
MTSLVLTAAERSTVITALLDLRDAAEERLAEVDAELDDSDVRVTWAVDLVCSRSLLERLGV